MMSAIHKQYYKSNQKLNISFWNFIFMSIGITALVSQMCHKGICGLRFLKNTYLRFGAKKSIFKTKYYGICILFVILILMKYRQVSNKMQWI